MKASKTLLAINTALENQQELDHRTHLGASLLGGPCPRKLWYGFRWAFKEQFGGRMLRLFERGQDEELRFYKYLELIGCNVWPIDPATGNQWRINFAGGHGGGSTDGIAQGIPDLSPDQKFVIECKTHGEKSFLNLQKEGLCQAKPEHFAQIQIYMVGLGIDRGLYMAVNKNTDELHLEIIVANPNFAKDLVRMGTEIIFAETPPSKIGGKAGAAFYQCKFCQFSDICHGNKLPEKNCRTCEFSKPLADGTWFCEKHKTQLDKKTQRQGCAFYTLKSTFIQ